MRTTCYDMLAYLRDFMGGDPTQEMDRLGKRAIQAALRELANAHNWTYFYQWGRLYVNALYNTGTVVMLVSSGTYAYEVTLTGGTWPSWAQYGTLRIGNVAYAVDRVISSTVLTLKSTLTSQSDIASSAYTLYRDTYTLPEDFIATDQGFAQISWGAMEYVHPNKWLAVTRFFQTYSSTPRYYSFTGDPKVPGRLAMVMFPFPSSDGTVDLLYKRRPRKPTLFEYTDDTVTITNGSPTITGNGTAFLSSMAGSVFRASATSVVPTDLAGENPAVQEANIARYTSTTVLTADADFTQSISGAYYRISDPVDIEDGAMLEAFYRCCEKHVTQMRRDKAASNYAMAYENALVIAKEADSRNFAQRAAGSASYWRQRLAYMPTDFAGDAVGP